MREFVQQFTADMPISEEFKGGFDSLDEAFTLLFKLYDHIEQYNEKKQFVDFIAKVYSVNGGLGNVADLELRGILGRLNFNIEANLFLEEYQKGMHAFKQWVFPFAIGYLSNHIAQSVPKNLEEAVRIYTKEIENLNEMLGKYDSSVVKQDNF